jgi:hypothetical protein
MSKANSEKPRSTGSSIHPDRVNHIDDKEEFEAKPLKLMIP